MPRTVMLPVDLTTNQVKNQAGTENEFIRSRSGDTRVEWRSGNAQPNLDHLLTVSHQKVGTGASRRRRSMVRVDLEKVPTLDLTKTAKTSAYIVLDFPEGMAENYEWAQEALANLLSFVGSTGANTTLMLDCSGTGAVPLINGSL